jgi:cytochrome oxidase assembly protein ShyY1
MNIKKKLLYTILTSPFFYLTFNAYRWQSRRKLEKIEEIAVRDKRLKEDGLILNQEILREFKMNDELEFKPVILKGYFSDDYVLVNRTREAEPGFHVVSPIYCYKDEFGVDQAVLVDRGWIPYSYREKFFDKNKQEKNFYVIKGVLYKGDTKSKYSLSSAGTNVDKDKLISMNPEEISDLLKLGNKNISSQFVVKEIDFDFINKNKGMKSMQYPIRVSYNDLMVWYVTPKKHEDYANFWITVTVMNFISNLFVWMYL